MKKSFLARRVPRKIGQTEDEPLAGSSEEQQISGTSSYCRVNAKPSLTSPSSFGSPLTSTCTEPIIKRPAAKPRKASSLRQAFGPAAVEDDDTEPAGVVTPKRSNISRLVIQRNAAKRSSLLASSLPARESEDDGDQPSYSASYLQELKNSTPTTPRDLAADVSNSEVDDVADSTQALDLSTKFGSSLSRYQQPSAIPSAAEIAEKKARRARLAKEEVADEYISLNPSDPELDDDDDDNVTKDDRGRLILKPKDKYSEAENRLQREDEDIMENFDEFTEAEGKILLGRKAEAEAARKRKADMAAQIAEAEGVSDTDSDASERERNEAFEAAQTKHGTYAANDTPSDPYVDARPKTPPIITPLPTLDSVIERLRKQVADMQTSRMQKLREMEALQREKIRLGEEEVRIQKALRETADKFAQLRAEKGISASVARASTPALDAPGLGAGPDFAAGLGSDFNLRDVNGGHAGLGFGLPGRGLESLGASAVGTPTGVDGEEGSSVNSDTIAT